MKFLLSAVAAIFALTLSAHAVAAPCSTYPYTLTNGQVADANQVMANFNSVRNCVTSNAAANGANSDITSLTGLTTPLSVAQGGTGASVSQVIGAYNSTGTLTTGAHMVIGSIVSLSTGTTLTLTGAAVFSSTGSYTCVLGDASGGPGITVSYARLAANSVRFFNSNSGETDYICTGT